MGLHGLRFSLTPDRHRRLGVFMVPAEQRMQLAHSYILWD